jgi:hypothetical protein
MLGELSLFCLKELGVGHKTLVHPHRIYGSVQMDIQRPSVALAVSSNHSSSTTQCVS